MICNVFTQPLALFLVQHFEVEFSHLAIGKKRFILKFLEVNKNSFYFLVKQHLKYSKCLKGSQSVRGFSLSNMPTTPSPDTNGKNTHQILSVTMPKIWISNSVRAHTNTHPTHSPSVPSSTEPFLTPTWVTLSSLALLKRCTSPETNVRLSLSWG